MPDDTPLSSAIYPLLAEASRILANRTGFHVVRSELVKWDMKSKTKITIIADPKDFTVKFESLIDGHVLGVVGPVARDVK